MPSIDSNFDWVDTPNPQERGFMITAKEGPNDAIPSFIEQTIFWSDCPDWVKRAESIPPALQGYTLVNAYKSSYQKRSFVFAKTRTEAERNTPFRINWVKRPTFWPTVLLKLWFEKGNLPLSAQLADGTIQNAARTHVRSKSRDGKIYPTWFKISEYLSERPWPKRATRSPTPITDSIHWSFDGNEGGFPECLHPHVRFPMYQTSGQVVFGAGTVETSVGSDIVAQEFPATPMTDWERYIEEDTSTNVGGFYLRTVVEAYPPIDDREDTN